MWVLRPQRFKTRFVPGCGDSNLVSGLLRARMAPTARQNAYMSLLKWGVLQSRVVLHMIKLIQKPARQVARRSVPIENDHRYMPRKSIRKILTTFGDEHARNGSSNEVHDPSEGPCVTWPTGHAVGHAVFDHVRLSTRTFPCWTHLVLFLTAL